MLGACFAQVQSLSIQITRAFGSSVATLFILELTILARKDLQKSVKREQGCRSDSHLSPDASFVTTVSEDKDRKSRLISVLRNVIATSVCLCLCMFSYMSLCVAVSDSPLWTDVNYAHRPVAAGAIKNIHYPCLPHLQRHARCRNR